VTLIVSLLYNIGDNKCKEFLPTNLQNPYLTNYGQNAYFWTFFEIMTVSAVSAGYQNPQEKKINQFKKNGQNLKKIIFYFLFFKFILNKFK
jgi:hypothetical protein